MSRVWRPRVTVTRGAAEHYMQNFLKRVEFYEIDRMGKEHKVSPQSVASIDSNSFEAWKIMKVVVKIPIGKEGFLIRDKYEPRAAKDVIPFAREFVEEAARYGNARKYHVVFEAKYNQELRRLERKFLERH